MRACELLIRVHDNESSQQGLAIGAVIAVCNAGWKWSEKERTEPFWRLVRLIGIRADEVNQILATMHVEVPHQRSFLHLELANLDPAFVADDSRQRAMIQVVYDGKADKRFFHIRRRAVSKPVGNLKKSIRARLFGDPK